MKFNSQICTSRQQSERLLALGLKKETADMTLQTTLDVCYTTPFQESVEYFENRHLPPHPTILPAWSLHRLIGMMPDFSCIYDLTNMHTMKRCWYVGHVSTLNVSADELIDALYAMVVKLKEEGVV